MMKTLAFLQNAWWKPGTDERHIKLYETDQNFHRRVLAMSATGRALRRALGADIYDQVVWDNASLEHGATRDAAFKPDWLHMLRATARLRPDLVLLFGRQAIAGWDIVIGMADENVWVTRIKVLSAPHPMARGSAKRHLEEISAEVKRLCAE